MLRYMTLDGPRDPSPRWALYMAAAVYECCYIWLLLCMNAAIYDARGSWPDVSQVGDVYGCGCMRILLYKAAARYECCYILC